MRKTCLCELRLKGFDGYNIKPVGGFSSRGRCFSCFEAVMKEIEEDEAGRGRESKKRGNKAEIRPENTTCDILQVSVKWNLI